MRVSVVAGLILAVHVAVIGSVVMTQGCASTQSGTASTVPAPVETAPVPPMPPSVAVVPPVAPSAPVAFPVIQPPVEPAPLKTSVAAENVYVVKSGDSLSKIAAAHGVKTKDLMAANGIADANKIRAGQKLAIPGAKAAAKSEPAKVEEKPAEAPVAPLPAPVPEVAAPASEAAPEAMPAPAVAAPAAPAVPAAPVAGQDAMLDYTVQDGDTAEGIARLFVVNKDDILSVNGIPAGSDVKPGQKIKIPPSSM